MVGAPRVRQRHELAQGDERDEAEQQRRAERARHPGDPEQHGADPDRAQLAREAVAKRRLLGRQVAQRPAEGEERDQRQQPEQDDEQQRDLLR